MYSIVAGYTSLSDNRVPDCRILYSEASLASEVFAVGIVALFCSLCWVLRVYGDPSNFWIVPGAKAMFMGLIAVVSGFLVILLQVARYAVSGTHYEQNVVLDWQFLWLVAPSVVVIAFRFGKEACRWRRTSRQSCEPNDYSSGPHERLHWAVTVWIAVISALAAFEFAHMAVQLARNTLDSHHHVAVLNYGLRYVTTVLTGLSFGALTLSLPYSRSPYPPRKFGDRILPSRGGEGASNVD
jgi:hypothetical protein